MGDDLDWTNPAEVLVPEQQAVAVFRHVKGHVVIRQERHWDEEHDPFVFLSSPEAVRAVIRRLQSLLDEGSERA